MTEEELQIIINPLFRSTYKGSSAQLIAEGLIPEGFEWPSRSHVARFTKGLLVTEVHRCQPKGRGRTWINGDFWRLTRMEVGVSFCDHEKIQNYLKAREGLKQERRGVSALQALQKSVYTARKDTAFMGHIRAMTKLAAQGAKA
nr:hypothetical protein [uncultured Rhodoferax sp.]